VPFAGSRTPSVGDSRPRVSARNCVVTVSIRADTLDPLTWDRPRAQDPGLPVRDPTRSRTLHPDSVSNLWSTQGPLSFADCFHLALTRQLGMTRIVTFDQKMDRYPGVERVEP
jgi:hypothetical protein